MRFFPTGRKFFAGLGDGAKGQSSVCFGVAGVLNNRHHSVGWHANSISPFIAMQSDLSIGVSYLCD